MTTDPHRKRPWFQIHLSTAVVLMVVAGVLVGVNAEHFNNREHIPLSVRVADGYDDLTYQWIQVAGPSVDIRGSETSDAYCEAVMPGSYEFEIRVSDGTTEVSRRLKRQIGPTTSNLIWKFATSCAALLAVVLSCEYLIRRRERAVKQPHP